MTNAILPIGTIIRPNGNEAAQFAELKANGMSCFQLGGLNDGLLFGAEGRENTARLKAAMTEAGVFCTSAFLGFPKQDWSRCRETIGLVPQEFRAERMVQACRIADWAKALGLDELVVHVGFVPDDRNSDEYRSFIVDLKRYVRFLAENGQWLNFETGQETVEVLGNMLEDLDEPNLGINLDPANLLIYDVDPPMTLVEKLGKRIRHLHCKDAVRPTVPGQHGKETPLGSGATDFINLLKTLLDRGFRGPLIIEREILPGPEQTRDIRNAVALLKELTAHI